MTESPSTKDEEILSELVQLRDLFQRRLLDDKVKVRTVEELSKKLDGYFMLPLFREIILLLDRLDGYLSSESNSDPHDFISSIYEELLVIMQHYGIEQIKTCPIFSFATQKVIETVEQPDFVDGQVVQVVRKGYSAGESLLRPEEVIIVKQHAEDRDA